MDRQAREAKERMKQRPFSERLKHFVYYHKIHIAVTLFILVAVVSTVYSILTSEKYDLNVAYYGDRMFTDEQKAAFEEYLSGMIEDVDGDGETKVNFVVMTKSGTAHSSEYDMAIDQKFMVDIAAGENDIYIVKGNFYENIKPENDAGVAETSFPISDSEDILAILGASDTDEEYWCTRMQYENKKDEEDIKLYENAKHLESLFAK